MGQGVLRFSPQATSPVDVPFGGLNTAYPLPLLLPQPQPWHLPSDSGHSPLSVAGLRKVENAEQHWSPYTVALTVSFLFTETPGASLSAPAGPLDLGCPASGSALQRLAFAELNPELGPCSWCPSRLPQPASTPLSLLCFLPLGPGCVPRCRHTRPPQLARFTGLLLHPFSSRPMEKPHLSLRPAQMLHLCGTFMTGLSLSLFSCFTDF